MICIYIYIYVGMYLHTYVFSTRPSDTHLKQKDNVGINYMRASLCVDVGAVIGG